MRVDDVPLLLKPAFHTYGYAGGALFHGIQELLRRTCRFERPATSDAGGARIECIWHEHLPAYIAAYLPPRGRRYVWMNHPVWFMRPVHVLLQWSGVEGLALGSSGHGGQAALEQLARSLRDGYSTLLAVDGPAGPAHVLKRGALDLALMTELPVVAIRFEYERAVRVAGWDRKFYPLPFSRVRCVESAPLRVERANYEAVRRSLAAALG